MATRESDRERGPVAGKVGRAAAARRDVTNVARV